VLVSDDDEEHVYCEIDAGSVQYAKEAAAVPIDEFIEALQEMRRDGATHVIGLSGNYRGAGYVHLGLPEWADD
jgi:aryl-alcohol dehydrogenase-like predicted oxidoreductase